MTDTIIQLVNLIINDQLYGIDIQEIQNIERIKEITKVPKTAPAVKGVLNLRGEIIPVINIREQLRFDKGDFTEETRIVIVQTDEDKTGVIVDQVKEVIEVNVDDIEPVPNMGNFNSMINEGYISGVAKVHNNEQVISILNIKTIIDDAFKA